MAQSEQDWLSNPAPNYDGSRNSFGAGTQYGGAPKPWYNNETWAGAVAGSVKGVFDYLNMQEQGRMAKSMQNDRFAHENSMVNASVGRASSMPLLQRLTKPKVRK